MASDFIIEGKVDLGKAKITTFNESNGLNPESNIGFWKHDEDTADMISWQTYEDMSMNLDVEIEIVQTSTPEPMQASVLVEDDLSTDASKSLSSSVASYNDAA